MLFYSSLYLILILLTNNSTLRFSLASGRSRQTGGRATAFQPAPDTYRILTRQGPLTIKQFIQRVIPAQYRLHFSVSMPNRNGFALVLFHRSGLKRHSSSSLSLFEPNVDPYLVEELEHSHEGKLFKVNIDHLMQRTIQERDDFLEYINNIFRRHLPTGMQPHFMEGPIFHEVYPYLYSRRELLFPEVSKDPQILLAKIPDFLRSHIISTWSEAGLLLYVHTYPPVEP